MSCAGYLLVGLGAGSRGCASRDDLNFSGGDTGLIDASVETICAVGIINDMIFHFGFTALQTVLEERLMRRHYMHPVFLIGIEGVAGLIMASALFGAGAVGAHSFYFTHHMNQINQFFTQPLWWLTSIAFMFCILGFNMSLMFVTYYGSATLRTFVESSRLALAWSGDVLTRNAPVAWYLPPGFVLVLGGSLLYFWVTEHERLIRRAVSEPQPSDSAQVVVSVPSPAALIPTSGDDGKTDLPMESLGPDSNDVAVSRVVVSSTRIDVTPATDATAAVGVDPSDDSTPHPFAVGVVVVGSTAYFIYLHVLAHATGAMSTVDMAGSILMMFVVTAVFVARSNPCRVDRHSHDAGAAAKAEESTSPLLPSAALTSLNGGGSSVPSPPPSLPLVSISGNVAWSHTLSYRLITITVYWSTWAVFVPIFALLINQTLFADPNPLNTTAYSANFVTNVLRSFSAVVLGWCLLPLRSITVAYGRREVLTRIVLDLVDAFNLVDPSVIISPREHGGAGLNPNDFIDSILLGASVLFAGLTLLLIAVIGAASGLQDTSTPVMTSSPAAAAVAVAGGSAGGGAGPDPQRSRYKRDDQNDVRLFWVLVPYVASIVVNNTPFLILRIIIWVHTDYLSVALLAKNVLGVLLCAFFIGSTWIQHKQLLLQHPQPPQLQPSR